MKPKILILNNRVPYPLKDGGAKASHSLISGLIKQGLEVDLFFLNTKKHFVDKTTMKQVFHGANQIVHVNIDTDTKIAGAISSIIKGTSYNIERFDTAEAHEALKDLLHKNQYHIVHFETLFMAPYLETVQSFSNAKCVLRMHNVEHQIWKKLAKGSKSPIQRTYLSHLSSRLMDFEKNVVSKFDALLPISKADAAWVQLYSKAPLQVVPMGVEVKKYDSIQAGKNFFHIGSMEWLPNKEACELLVNAVWPKVLALDKDCHLHLAGKGMGDHFNRWESTNIHIHGEVDNAAAFMQSYHGMVIPLKSASGLRIKALEAMSLAKPIISTKVGMSGIEIMDGVNCIIANTIDEQVAAIVKLANDDKLYAQIAENAFNFVSNEYDNQQVITKTIKFYESIIE